MTSTLKQQIEAIQTARKLISHHKLQFTNVLDELLNDAGNTLAGLNYLKKADELLSVKYLNKIQEVCNEVSGNMLEMPAAIQAINALVNEFKTNQSKP